MPNIIFNIYIYIYIFNFKRSLLLRMSRKGPIIRQPELKERINVDYTLKPGSHDNISISIRAKQKAKQRNEVKPAT